MDTELVGHGMACGHRKVRGPTDHIYCQKYRGAVKERLAFRQTSPVKWLAITAFILNYMGQVPSNSVPVNVKYYFTSPRTPLPRS